MSGGDTRGIYFFLSFAHSSPVDGARVDPDHWVRAVFEDLCASVRARAAPSTGWRIGFYDGLLAPDSDWKVKTAASLGAAQVFVPLYSPAYLDRSWPLRERESFRRRLAALGAIEAEHLVPVLWTPTPTAWQQPDWHADDVPEYTTNGLRTLRMLSVYERPYREICERLARRIVEMAERDPLPVTRAPALDDITDIPQGDTAFVVAVVAPTVDDLPSGYPDGMYGRSGKNWRPYPSGSAAPAADYAADVAERLGLPTRVVDFKIGGGLLDRHPGLLLIDPWVLRTGRRPLKSALSRLPGWVTPLVLTDKNDPRSGSGATRLAAEVDDMLRHAGAARVKRAVTIHEFVRQLPGLVTEARRQYLRNADITPPKGVHVGRPHLVDRDAPTFVETGENTDD